MGVADLVYTLAHDSHKLTIDTHTRCSLEFLQHRQCTSRIHAQHGKAQVRTPPHMPIMHQYIYPRFPVPPRANVPPTAAAAAYSGTDPSYYGESANLAAPLAASSGNIFSAARRWIVEWNL